ncbi:MAG TPA: hypothetical protein VM142_01615 [Acidimicrobiales bacterium]|nr:hypothetical protein [Acidimicrobiales bacterium]
MGDAFNPEAKKAKKVLLRPARKKAVPFTIGQAFAHHPPAKKKKVEK